MKVRVNEKDMAEPMILDRTYDTAKGVTWFASKGRTVSIQPYWVALRIALNLNDKEEEKPWNDSNLYFQRRSNWAGKRTLHWSDQKARHGF